MIGHAKSSPVGDFTGTVTIANSVGSTVTAAATDLVRPSDWNSAHNQYYTLSGNTVGASTASGSNVVWQASGNLTLSGNGATIVVSQAPAPVSTCEPFDAMGKNTASVALCPNSTSNVASFFPINLPNAVAVDRINLVGSMAFLTVGTSSGRQTGGVSYALYSQGLAGNSSALYTMDSGSFGWSITANNSSYSISQAMSTNSAGYTLGLTNSAGLNITGGYTGFKMFQLPIGQTLSIGNYWLGLIGTNSTTSVNCGISLSLQGGSMSQSAFAPIGSFTSAYTAGQLDQAVGGNWYVGFGSLTTANQTALPATVAMSNLSNGLTMIPYMMLWST